MRRPTSLRVRIAAVVAVTMLAGLVAVAVAVYQIVEDRLMASAERQARDGLLIASAQLSAGAQPSEVISGVRGTAFFQLLGDDPDPNLTGGIPAEGTDVLTTLPPREPGDGTQVFAQGDRVLI